MTKKEVKEKEYLEFENFLEKYYLSSQKKSITSLFQKINALEEIKYSISTFYSSIKNENVKVNRHSYLTLLIRDFIVAINKGLSSIKEIETRSNQELILIQFSIFLVRDTYKISNIGSEEYFEILKQTLKSTYKKYRWKYEALDELLKIENLKNFIPQNDTSKSNNKIKTSKPIALSWNNENMQVDFFISDVIEVFKGIKNKRTLFNLFDRIENNFTINLPSDLLENFLVLFYFLDKQKVISCIGNRGLYTYLQNHLKATNGSVFPNSEFRKIRYNSFQNEKKKNKILDFLKPFNTYFPSGQMDDS
jgi:glutaredoxin-related protein